MKAYQVIGGQKTMHSPWCIGMTLAKNGSTANNVKWEGMKMKKHYRIREEFWDMWGVNNEEEAVINDDELKRLSIEWEIPVNELIQQTEQL